MNTVNFNNSDLCPAGFPLGVVNTRFVKKEPQKSEYATGYVNQSNSFENKPHELLARYVKIKEELHKKQRECITFKNPNDTDFNIRFERFLKIDDEKRNAFIEIFAEMKKDPEPSWAKDILEKEEEEFCKRDLRGDFIKMIASVVHVT